MNKQKLITIIIIVVGIVLILFGLFFPTLKQEENKKPNQKKESDSTEIIKASFKQIVEEMIAKDADAETLNEKYSIDYMGDAYLPFAKLNILSFKPSVDVETEELKACLMLTDSNYDDIIKQYKENLDYKISVDENKQIINLEIKTYYLKSYQVVLSNLTNLYTLEAAAEVSELSFFGARCSAIKKLQNHKDDFNNKDDYVNLTLNYRIENDEFLLEEYASLGSVLSGEKYLDLADEEIIKLNQNFEAKAKEIYEDK